MCVVALRHFYCIVLADISRRLLASHETVPTDKKVVALDDRRRATLLDLLLTFKFWRLSLVQQRTLDAKMIFDLKFSKKT